MNYQINKSKPFALVTGASRGIGEAIVNKLCEDYTIIGTSTTGRGNTQGVSKWLKANFSTTEGIEDFIDLLSEEPFIKVLVNNAGINIIKPHSIVTSRDYEEIHNVNLKAPYQISKLLSEKMAKNNGGKIVNIASIWSVVSKPYRSLYSSMKTGLVGMTKATSIELAAKNVLINSVSPGFVDTELTKNSLTNEQKKELFKQIPMNRFANSSEIAEVVSFLCSNKNTYLTGQNIVVDGGFTST